MKILKPILLILFTLSIIMLGVLYYNDVRYKNELNTCNLSKKGEDFLGCVERHKLTYQDTYDLFYNNYNKFDDGKFFLGYERAYSDCLANHKECNIRESQADWKKSRYEINRMKCINNYEDYCIKTIIKNDIYFSKMEKIELLKKAVLKNINTSDRACGQLNDFYKILNDKEKEGIDIVIRKECEKI